MVNEFLRNIKDAVLDQTASKSMLTPITKMPQIPDSTAT